MDVCRQQLLLANCIAQVGTYQKSNIADFMKSSIAHEITRKRQFTKKNILDPQREPVVLRELWQPAVGGQEICPPEGLQAR